MIGHLNRHCQLGGHAQGVLTSQTLHRVTAAPAREPGQVDRHPAQVDAERVEVALHAPEHPVSHEAQARGEVVVDGDDERVEHPSPQPSESQSSR